MLREIKSKARKYGFYGELRNTHTLEYILKNKLLFKMCIQMLHPFQIVSYNTVEENWHKQELQNMFILNEI